MLVRFIDFFNKKNIFTSSDKVLLAVSGGIDSVVLAALFREANCDFAIAHCNFQLRGDDSEGDEIFVQKLAEKHGVPFFCNRFNTRAYAQKKGISTQMAARDLRYAWFEGLLEEGFDFVATAHHQNDVLETVLLNLTRGTGIAGLHGIRVKNKHVIRPLLFATREEIEEYAKEQAISWREDASNKENKYRRNLLRNEVIPLLKKINPNLEESIQQSIEKIKAVEHIFDESVEEIRQMILQKGKKEIQIDINALQNLIEPTLYLYELIKEYHFSYAQAKQVVQVLHKHSGRVFESWSHSLVKDREKILITPKKQENVLEVFAIPSNVSVLKAGNFSLIIAQEDIKDFKVSTESHIACLDLDTLVFPLTVRTWQEGDYFYPLGMSHRQKLSKFLINQKVSLSQKKNIWVLCSEGAVVWVIGYRLDNRFKITENTQKIYKITFQS